MSKTVNVRAHTRTIGGSGNPLAAGKSPTAGVHGKKTFAQITGGPTIGSLKREAQGKGMKGSDFLNWNPYDTSWKKKRK